MSKRNRFYTLGIAVVTMFAVAGDIGAQTTTRKATASHASAAGIKKPAQKAIQPPAGPTLKETLAFIRDTLTDHGYSRSANKSFGFSMFFITKLDMSTSEGCDVELTERTTSTTNWTTGKTDVESSPPVIFTVPLAHLDPTSALAANDVPIASGWTANGAHVTVRTFNNQRIIRQVKDGVTTFSSEYEIGLSDLEQATRLAKAVAHAVDLCGGKPSAF
jgi:hypothetical protein